MVKKICLMFALCGGIYVLLELLFRGRSHISMFFAGGLSAVCIFFGCQLGRLRTAHTVAKCLFGSAVITVVEFVTGAIVNLWLELEVWDYSDVPFNLLGQICLPFSLIWFAITLPILKLGTLLCGKEVQFSSTAARKRSTPDMPASSGE